MLAKFAQHISKTLDEIKAQGLYKTERIITGPQNAEIPIADGRRVINLCANNYLGLADHPALVAAAKEALDTHGFGMASVRFICGTQDIHKELEAALTSFLGTEATILYPSCFDANGGLFETLLGAEDAVISDELNHASIIDGVRLCKAQRFRYKHNEMADLETKLKEASGARFRLIATDGCFSMDGTIADLGAIVDLAEKYHALTMIDDAHATGFLGKTGRGTHEYRGVMGKIDIISGTLGKALGGASGGFTSGRKEIVDLLRQRSRPYLFSNSVAPHIVAATLKALEMLSTSTELRDKLEESTKYFREALTERGLTIKSGVHPIVPIMLGDAALSQKFAARMLEKGVYVIGFFYPVVPHGTARVRTQVSAAHSREELEFAVNAFAEVSEELRNSSSGAKRSGVERSRGKPDSWNDGIPRLSLGTTARSQAMLYMVIERFKDASAIYRRLREKGRMMPDRLEYVSSWINVDLTICYQLMRTDDASLFPLWTENWKDLMDFEIVAVRSSAELVELMNRG